jgi:hypothetical protein
MPVVLNEFSFIPVTFSNCPYLRSVKYFVQCRLFPAVALSESVFTAYCIKQSNE